MSTNWSHCGTFENTFPLKTTHIVFFSVIFLLSLVGNAFIIIVVYKRPELRKTVNYFIVNMAISDFVFPLTAVSASLGETVDGSWVWSVIGDTAGLILCKIRTFLMAVSLTVSIESLVWIAFDRFLAVVWPMKVRLISSRFRGYAIGSTWILAAILNCLELYYSELIKLNHRVKCHYINTNSLTFIVYRFVKVAVIYISPMILLTMLYSAIAVTLRRKDKVLQCSTAQRNDHKKQLCNHKKRQAIKMSLCVVTLFYLFFFPHIMASIFLETPVSHSCSYYHFFLFSSSAVCISTMTNPIICFIFVQSFRRGVSAVFSCFQRKRFKTRAIERTGREEVILKSIKVISRKEEDPEFNETLGATELRPIKTQPQTTQ